MTKTKDTAWTTQQERNRKLLKDSLYMREKTVSRALPFRLDRSAAALDAKQATILQALQVEAARTSVRALASLARINELDHLGGGLDLIPALAMTLAFADQEQVAYTIENAHTSVGYYSLLAAYGYLDREVVVEKFRRSLDIPGHVSWVPGGTQLNGGRLGVMIPVAVGQALGLRARVGARAWVICHCGDAGWISGQALNGFNGAALHKAPVTFVMHRNGMQLSDSTKKIMDVDPRPIVQSLGIRILEIPTIHDEAGLFKAYREAAKLASEGVPSMIYPVGFRSEGGRKVTIQTLADQHGIRPETEAFAKKNGVAMDREIWIPGALMSYRDVTCMLECVFLANDLPGGKDHHDGHMKGRDEAAVLANPMLSFSKAQQQALEELRAAKPLEVTTAARPAPGAPNLVLPEAALKAAVLPKAGEEVSPRAGSELAYDLVARQFPQDVFVVSCDLDPSTKLGKARKHLAKDHQFEMSIEEQVAALMADGLAMSSRKPQLAVVSTFAAFFEGIAREGLELWRYQRNLNGSNEGLNVVMHLSHVGACTGRDHFSGWSLDWVTLAMGYLPYLHRFYAPADARAAFVAVRDAAAHYGAHIVAIPRDNLPILTKQDGKTALWEADSAWEALTTFRTAKGAKRAILALGATAFVADKAFRKLEEEGLPVDAYVVNGLPFPEGAMAKLLQKYPEGLVTIEDGLIGTREVGLRGLASLVVGAAAAAGVRSEHVGIVDPRIAPAEGHLELWEHFGLTPEALVRAVKDLQCSCCCCG